MAHSGGGRPDPTVVDNGLHAGSRIDEDQPQVGRRIRVAVGGRGRRVVAGRHVGRAERGGDAGVACEREGCGLGAGSSGWTPQKAHSSMGSASTVGAATAGLGRASTSAATAPMSAAHANPLPIDRLAVVAHRVVRSSRRSRMASPPRWCPHGTTDGDVGPRVPPRMACARVRAAHVVRGTHPRARTYRVLRVRGARRACR